MRDYSGLYIYAVVVITNCVGHACWKIARQHVPHNHHKLFANSIALVYCVTLYLPLLVS